jgi:hypothetical protein
MIKIQQTLQHIHTKMFVIITSTMMQNGFATRPKPTQENNET